MPFEFLPDVAIADIAFRATAPTTSGLFETSALAMTEIMVDPRTLNSSVTKELSLESEDLDRLLYDFLTELIVMKDVDSLLFKEVEVHVADDGRSLKASLKGEPIDRVRHELRNDVKAVTMHMFGVTQAKGSWQAVVVLDI